MVNTDMTETIIIGDFNMNYMDEKHMRQCKFKNFLLELNMRQMINEGTRITKKSRTTIDLIITDCPYVKGNMHMISPDRTRFCCQILSYLVTIHLLYGTDRCLSY